MDAHMIAGREKRLNVSFSCCRVASLSARASRLAAPQTGLDHLASKDAWQSTARKPKNPGASSSN
eukprot:3068230-Pyramimonas_sp.AAC.1